MITNVYNYEHLFDIQFCSSGRHTSTFESAPNLKKNKMQTFYKVKVYNYLHILD